MVPTVVVEIGGVHTDGRVYQMIITKIDVSVGVGGKWAKPGNAGLWRRTVNSPRASAMPARRKPMKSRRRQKWNGTGCFAGGSFRTGRRPHSSWALRN